MTPRALGRGARLTSAPLFFNTLFPDVMIIGNQVAQPGQACTRNACKGTYQGPESDEEPCLHHPGAPVFHEGCGRPQLERSEAASAQSHPSNPGGQ